MLSPNHFFLFIKSSRLRTQWGSPGSRPELWERHPPAIRPLAGWRPCRPCATPAAGRTRWGGRRASVASTANSPAQNRAVCRSENPLRYQRPTVGWLSSYSNMIEIKSTLFCCVFPLLHPSLRTSAILPGSGAGAMPVVPRGTLICRSCWPPVASPSPPCTPLLLSSCTAQSMRRDARVESTDRPTPPGRTEQKSVLEAALGGTEMARADPREHSILFLEGQIFT